MWVHCTHAVLDGMIAQRSGKIVNIASDAGRVGGSAAGQSIRSEGGGDCVPKAVAKEVGRYNIHVNCVCPGFTKNSATTERLTPDLKPASSGSIPSAALVSPKMSRRL